MPAVITYSGVLGPYSPITFTRASTATYFNASGVLTTAAVNEGRLDYDPSTLAPLGFLVEEARTNSIRNNTMQGAVAGTPGTLPTNWAVSNLGTLTQQVIGTGTVNGITYIDIRFSGTTSTTQLSIRLESNGILAVPASNGQTWTTSMWSAIVGGGLTNITSRGYSLLYWDNASSFLGGGGAGTFNSTATLTRSSETVTIAQIGTAFIQPQIYLVFNSGVAIDITLRIGLPQLENNNISTGVASATVAAGGTGYAVGDVLQIVGGTGSTAARLTVATLSGSAVATVTVSTAGSYSVFPSPQPVSVTAITGTGTSATFNIVPQTQTGFATSVIPTTTTALPRSADVASVNTLSPWYNASAGTLFSEWSILGVRATNNQRVWSLSDGTNSQFIAVRIDSVAQIRGEQTGGSTVPTTVLAVASANTVYKTGVTFQAGDSAICLGGGTVYSNTTFAYPAGINKLTLGNLATGSFELSGHLRRITYYPRKLSSAELQAITA